MPQVGAFVAGFVKGVATFFGGTQALSYTASAAQVAGYTAGSSAVTGFIVKTGVTIATSAAASKVAMDRMGDEPPPSSLSNVLDPMPSSRTIYGKTKTGGVIVFAKATRGYTASQTTKKNQILHLVIELAGHQCQSIDQIYLGNTPLNIVQVSASNPVSSGEVFPSSTAGTDANGVTRYTANGTDYDGEIGIKVYTGTQTQADADLVEATLKQQVKDGDLDLWPTTAVGKGKTYVYIRLHFKSQLFRGIPQFTFDVKGKRFVKFLGGSSYSENPINCLYDYMTLSKERGGFGVDPSEINQASWTAASAKCNETVTIRPGVTQPRYFCGGIISAGQEPQAIIKSLLDSCAGVMEWVAGQWYVWTYKSSDIVAQTTITESELLDFPNWQLNQSSKDAINSIKPVIRSIETAWQPSDVESVEALRKIWGSTSVDVFTSAGHNLKNGDRVKLVWWTGTTIDNSVLISRGFQPEFYYYVINATTNTFKISLTEGGSSLNFGAATSGQITALHDIYLSIDGERNSSDQVFTMVNDAVMARRLAVINLRQARQEVTGTILCKPGTNWSCPADLFVGDTIRILNNELSFYEPTASFSGSCELVNDTITSNGHGLTNGSAVVFSAIDGSTGLSQNRIYYVRDSATNTFKVTDYRGGPAIDIKATYLSGVNFSSVEGKLFRIISYRPIISDGIFSIELGVRATATNIYDWTDDREIAPAATPGITVPSLYDVEALTNFAADSGTNELYIKKDGTVVSRVKLSWDVTDDEYIAASGQVDIEYKLASDTEWIKYPKVIGSATEAYLTDVTDGELYDFRARFRNAFGKEGPWSLVDDHLVQGKTAAPGAPFNLTATYVDGGDRIDLQWTNPSDLDLSHTVIGRSVSYIQTIWQNRPNFEYDSYNNGISYPDGFYANKTQNVEAAYATSKLKIFTFPSGSTLRIQFVYQRLSGSESENPVIYGVNGTDRCTEISELFATNANQLYSQFIDLTVKSSSGTDADGSFVAGPCNGFYFKNDVGDTVEFEVSYFNARDYPAYETVAEVPAGTTRGKSGSAAIQTWTDAPILKSDSARNYYYEIYSVDTSGNISTKIRANRRITEWGRVQGLSVAVTNNTADITWNDSGSDGTVVIQLSINGESQIYRIAEENEILQLAGLALNSTYTVRAWIERFFGGLTAVSQEVATTFNVGATPVPLALPDYYYIRPPSP